jgi:hypothetical protein
MNTEKRKKKKAVLFWVGEALKPRFRGAFSGC